MRDYECAEIVCMDCGFVITAKIADLGPEWRAFDHEQRAKRARVGAPFTFTIHDLLYCYCLLDFGSWILWLYIGLLGSDVLVGPNGFVRCIYQGHSLGMSVLTNLVQVGKLVWMIFFCKSSISGPDFLSRDFGVKFQQSIATGRIQLG